ncbi:MAG: hypothetical protein IPI67_32495 [Myxococcales bacterium]|nr:hypothetical protein [Myxococcales bacterium]
MIPELAPPGDSEVKLGRADVTGGAGGPSPSIVGFGGAPAAGGGAALGEEPIGLTTRVFASSSSSSGSSKSSVPV